jgi:3-phenylpropionate/trans-cinnamate dioxygenase ferredoxin reductase subunit
MSGVVVVGAGQAGCQLVTSLREGGYRGAVTLVGSEQHPPYQRPPLSKGHLTGKAARASLWLRPEAWFAEHDVTLRLGRAVTAIDRTAKTVLLDDRTSISYEALVLALGARHRELALEGRELRGVHALRSLDEADQVRSCLEGSSHVVVVGGGFIGMEVAATAAALGKSTCVLEIAPQLMGRVLSAQTAAFLVDAHARRGLDVRLGTSAVAADGSDDQVTSLRTSGGAALPADLVLLGVGAVPHVELAAAAGLEVEDGIVVDALLRTSDPDIYAIGDCASAPSPFAGGARIRLESVQNATAQARAVAATLLGTPTRNLSVPWFWSDQADLKLQIAGVTTGHDEVVVRGDPEGERFSSWCFRDGSLVGVESVNSQAEHMAARRLMSVAPRIAPAHLRAPDFDPKRAASALVPAGA